MATTTGSNNPKKMPTNIQEVAEELVEWPVEAGEAVAGNCVPLWSKVQTKVAQWNALGASSVVLDWIRNRRCLLSLHVNLHHLIMACFGWKVTSLPVGSNSVVNTLIQMLSSSVKRLVGSLVFSLSPKPYLI